MAEENMKTPLLEDFAPISTQDWNAKTTADLKGADFERKLVWRTLEGFNLKPYHRAEDIENLDLTKAKPGEFPYVRGNSNQNNDWEVRQDIRVSDTKDVTEANKLALDILYKGVTSVGFRTACKPVTTAEEMSSLLNDINPVAASVNFWAGSSSLSTLKLLIAEFAKQKADKAAVKGSVCYDPMGHLTKTGRFRKTEAEDLAVLKEMVVLAKTEAPNVRVINVDGQLFHNAGATAVQELGYALATASEYVAKLIDLGLNVNDIAPRMQFTFAIGANYFMEMAKVRAARYLWAKVLKAYGADDENCKTFIHAVTSKWNQTVYDPNVNMLRNTTEAMSAVLGGVDSLEVLPHNVAYENSNEFSERIARNVQLLLKEESYLDKVVDPAAGSYFIETITENLINGAWDLFKGVEAEGGFVAAFTAGTIQEQVAASAQKRDMNLATRKEILLGTNQYPNADEAKAEVIANKPAPKCSSSCDNTLAAPLKLYRGAMAFEDLRLKTEALTKRPTVFMLTYGNLAMRKARAMFATNFFACAGFNTVDNNGFATPLEGVQAAKTAGANIVVLCSADDEYAEMAKVAKAELPADTIVVVAGNPKEAEAIKANGVTDFVHVRTNVLESLTDFQNRLNTVLA